MWNYSIHTTKEIIFRVNKQPTEWEKIFSSYTSDRVLISKLYKELKKIKHQNHKTADKWLGK